MSESPARALLTGAEPPLRDLVRDVLAEAGVDLAPEGASGPSVLVMLVPTGQANLAEQVKREVARASPTPVLVLLPYPDDRLSQTALAAGACGAHSLWGSLGGLREVVERTLAQRGPARSTGSTR